MLCHLNEKLRYQKMIITMEMAGSVVQQGRASDEENRSEQEQDRSIILNC